MESPDHTHIQADASAAHKCSNGEENNVPPPSVQRAGNAQPRRALAALGAARDAVEPPQRECFDLSDGERAGLLAYLAESAATKPTALKVAQAPSDRTKRAAGFAQIRGHEAVDVDAHTAAALLAAYAPEERPSEAGTGATCPKDPRDWVYLKTEEQREWTIEYLREKNCLHLADEVINKVSRL